MKSLKIAMLFVCFALVAQAQTVTVKGNSKLNVDFGKYKSYTWAKSAETIPAEEFEIYTYSNEVTVPKNSKDRKGTPVKYVYTYDVIIPSANPTVNSVIRDAVDDEMEGRAYTKRDGGDLMVTYRVLERKAKMYAYSNDNPEVVGAKQVRQAKDTASYWLAPGTLVISLIDVRTSQVVWDGFASGLFQEDAFINDEVKLKEAVHLVFGEFKYRRDKIVKGE